MSDKSLIGKLKIIEIVSDRSPWDGSSVRRVTIAYSLEKAAPLTATFFIDQRVDDNDVVRLCRNYFHRLTSKLGSDTESWKLSDEEVELISGPK
ncbi:hypothetical protein [Pelagibacterium sediminicola]|uniref:hypothetical protein n=1 Tax=Pelagibacterium sediminicola TaxID=2248761 RepID=UPI00130050A6|nr:hypothetical protein [Pelagibacterium sediminicola]